MRYTNVFAFRRWLDSLGVVLAFWISILKSQITSKIIYRGIEISQASKKTFVNFLTSYSEHFVKNLVKRRFMNMFMKQSFYL